jgi:hypothetical protein
MGRNGAPLDAAVARVWAGLTAAERQAAEHLLVQLVRPVPDTTGFTRRAAARSELHPAAWAVAAKLATARLLVVASLVESMFAPMLKVWEVSTGRVIAQVMVPPEARSALGRGLALDASETRLALTWLPDLQAPPNMDAGSLATAIRDQHGTRVALFAVPHGRPLGTLQAPGGWLVVRPLGSSADSPVELSEGSLVPLVLPSSARDPGARLVMPAQEAPEPATAYAALCAKLLDRTESREVARARPEGAYTGDVCG